MAAPRPAPQPDLSTPRRAYKNKSGLWCSQGRCLLIETGRSSSEVAKLIHVGVPYARAIISGRKRPNSIECITNIRLAFHIDGHLWGLAPGATDSTEDT